MPGLPIITSSTLPNPMFVLNLARQRTNDLIDGVVGAPAPVQDPALFYTQIGGSNLLDVSTPDASNRTQVIFQSAYEQFKEYLEDLGSRMFIGTTQPPIVGLPANTSPDPSAQSYISWTEFFDGQFYWPQPILPSDFFAPLRIGERITGTNAPFFPMSNPPDGIRNNWVRGIYNRQWEWRENRLYLAGAVGPTDLEIRYIKGLPPIAAVGTIPWYYLPLPIPGAANALSWYVAAEVGSARGPDFVADVTAKGQASADLLFNRQARADQRQNVRRRPRGTAGRGGNFSYGI